MKFLIYPSLEKYSQQIHHLDLGDRVFLFRIEAYSCKKAGEQRRSFKKLIKLLKADIQDRKNNQMTCQTHLGDISTPQVQKRLISLITCLNCSFPDYDFSDLDGDNFMPTPPKDVLEILDSEVLIPSDLLVPNVRNNVLESIKEVIDPDTSEAYVLNHDADSPLFMNKLWAYTCFFFSAKLKRVLLISCASKSKLTCPSLLPTGTFNDIEEDVEEEEEEQYVVSHDDTSDYDWDNDDEQLALQAQWLSDDDGDDINESVTEDAVVDTSLLDLEEFVDQPVLPDQSLVTPSLQPLDNPSNNSGHMLTLQGKPSPFILPIKSNFTPPDFS